MGDVIAFPRSLLWREAVGHELRRERLAQERTQGDVAAAAGISTQYLSEVERGRKEPSSEILEAALGALDLDLSTLANRVAELTEPMSAPAGPATSARPSGPVLLAA
ncbi:helix-turn-helix domain-containing protein [Pseudactinotalea suaedae]|jgi:transcriptional regulator with XRE-family HTH domain|uniref:helix-turn-helix domain-containing protein n=1 Tax=Pseudactinotalea suaedae TaxID=1524924 RepID=UPI0012E2EF4D|nr:helix-turn-helix transcriptional regulator [Pseudactinotalea suaedae]